MGNANKVPNLIPNNCVLRSHIYAWGHQIRNGEWPYCMWIKLGLKTTYIYKIYIYILFFKHHLYVIYFLFFFLIYGQKNATVFNLCTLWKWIGTFVDDNLSLSLNLVSFSLSHGHAPLLDLAPLSLSLSLSSWCMSPTTHSKPNLFSLPFLFALRFSKYYPKQSIGYVWMEEAHNGNSTRLMIYNWFHLKTRAYTERIIIIITEPGDQDYHLSLCYSVHTVCVCVCEIIFHFFLWAINEGRAL